MPAPSTARRPIPDIAQYKAGVRGGKIFDPECLACVPKMGKVTRAPIHYAGAFAVAFPLLDATTGECRFAVRFWIQRVPGDTLQRYRCLEIFLDELPRLRRHFAGFRYFAEGIGILMSNQMETYPMLRMEWVEGLSPRQLVEGALQLPDPARRRARLTQGARAWQEMLQALQSVGASHGDLWNDNIRFVEEGAGMRCVLLDYDSIFVPGLVHPPKITGSVSGYRNPNDRSVTAGAGSDIELETVESTAADDYFSGFAMLLSLEALAWCPELWDRFGGKESGENEFLFRESDFVNPDSSALFTELTSPAASASSTEGARVKQMAEMLRDICRKKLKSQQLAPLAKMIPTAAAPTGAAAGAVSAGSSASASAAAASASTPVSKRVLPAQKPAAAAPSPSPAPAQQRQAHPQSQPQPKASPYTHPQAQAAAPQRQPSRNPTPTPPPQPAQTSQGDSLAAIARLIEQQLHNTGYKQVFLFQRNGDWILVGHVKSTEDKQHALELCHLNGLKVRDELLVDKGSKGGAGRLLLLAFLAMVLLGIGGILLAAMLGHIPSSLNPFGQVKENAQTSVSQPKLPVIPQNPRTPSSNTTPPAPPLGPWRPSSSTTPPPAPEPTRQETPQPAPAPSTANTPPPVAETPSPEPEIAQQEPPKTDPPAPPPITPPSAMDNIPQKENLPASTEATPRRDDSQTQTPPPVSAPTPTPAPSPQPEPPSPPSPPAPAAYTSYYSGTLTAKGNYDKGKSLYNITMTLKWNPDRTVTGSYSFVDDGKKKAFALEGTNPRDGVVNLAEYMSGKLSATINLRKTSRNGKTFWVGEMANTIDERRFEVMLQLQ